MMRISRFLPVIILLVLFVLVLRFTNGKAETSATPELRNPTLADGCDHIYLDLGTNIGIQIRKLFQPELYPKAKMTLDMFDAAFGKERSHVCAFGWEPNPTHTEYLREVEAYLQKKGFRVLISTETAVSTQDKTLTFYRDEAQKKNNEFGASLNGPRKGGSKKGLSVRGIDFSSWFKREIMGRRLAGKHDPAVIMKIDIEGHDHLLLMAMLIDGTLCHVDRVYGEHMKSEFVDAVKKMHQVHPERCKTIVSPEDDESYGTVRLPLE